MPVPTPKLSGNKSKKFELVIDEFKEGVITEYDESRIPEKAARQAQNLMQVQDGLWGVRWGTKQYGATYTGPIDGWFVAVKDDGDGTTTQEIIIIDNGTPKKSTDGGSWSTITGATYTVGKRATFAQLGSKVYIANGTDDLSFYDLSVGTISTYTGESVPTNPSASRTTLTTGDYNAYYRVTTVSSVGETGATATFSVSGGLNKERSQWKDDGTEYLTLSWDDMSGSADFQGYNVYYGDASGYEVFLASTPTNSYIDDGSASPNPYIEYPDDDTTTGPTFSQVSVVGNRLWGTGDPTNPWRVYWSGVGNSEGAWSPFFGGGYVDLEKGGKQRPQSVQQFRTGKGDPIATVLSSDPDGNGATWQIELIATSIGSTAVIIPASYKVIGSVGTNAPNAVVQARNSIFFANSQGLFTIGTKPQLLNVLATDEISQNIRSSWESLSQSSMDQAEAYEYDGKIFFAMPTISGENNQIWILDLERRNWTLPWTLGVKGFLEYTDSSGETHLLAVPESGTKLIEFSEQYKGDSGSGFTTIYQTPLIHVDDTHTRFAFIEKVTVEFGRPKGQIDISVAGTQRSKAFSSIKQRTIAALSSVMGFTSAPFSSTNFSDNSNAPETFASSSLKKELKVKKPLNNIQIQISSDDVDQEYVINRIIVQGRMVNITSPSSWRN